MAYKRMTSILALLAMMMAGAWGQELTSAPGCHGEEITALNAFRRKEMPLFIMRNRFPDFQLRQIKVDEKWTLPAQSIAESLAGKGCPVMERDNWLTYSCIGKECAQQDCAAGIKFWGNARAAFGQEGVWNRAASEEGRGYWQMRDYMMSGMGCGQAFGKTEDGTPCQSVVCIPDFYVERFTFATPSQNIMPSDTFLPMPNIGTEDLKMKGDRSEVCTALATFNMCYSGLQITGYSFNFQGGATFDVNDLCPTSCLPENRKIRQDAFWAHFRPAPAASPKAATSGSRRMLIA